MSELGKRVSVAVVAIPTVLGLVYVGGWVLAVPLAAFAALGAHELQRLASAAGLRPLTALGVLGAAALVLLGTWRPSYAAFAPWALGVLCAVASAAIFLAVIDRSPDEGPFGAVGSTVFATLYAGLSLAIVPLLDAMPADRAWAEASLVPWSGLMVIVLPLAVTWIGDATAYFAGTAWGRHRMAPTISPKKSWEGFWAELVGAGAAGAGWYAAVGPYLPGMSISWLEAIAIGVVLGLGAVGGDLAESLFKREAGVKDSGTFFPGHGGVLDRIDSLVVNIPVAYVALSLLGGGA